MEENIILVALLDSRFYREQQVDPIPEFASWNRVRHNKYDHPCTLQLFGFTCTCGTVTQNFEPRVITTQFGGEWDATMPLENACQTTKALGERKASRIPKCPSIKTYAVWKLKTSTHCCPSRWQSQSRGGEPSNHVRECPGHDIMMMGRGGTTMHTKAA
jgi:hypothetical protein